MTTKEQIFEKIGGDQVHHLCGYLISKRFQPSFSYYPADGGSFSSYNGHSWYNFYDGVDGKSDTELEYNLSMPLDHQDESVYDGLLRLLESV